MTREETEQSLLELLVDLGNDELRSLHWIARRLLAGQRLYGRVDIAKDPRNWRAERDEEIADAIVYVSFEALRRGDEARAPRCISDYSGSRCQAIEAAPNGPPKKPRIRPSRVKPQSESQHSQPEGGSHDE